MHAHAAWSPVCSPLDPEVFPLDAGVACLAGVTAGEAAAGAARLSPAAAQMAAFQPSAPAPLRMGPTKALSPFLGCTGDATVGASSFAAGPGSSSAIVSGTFATFALAPPRLPLLLVGVLLLLPGVVCFVLLGVAVAADLLGVACSSESLGSSLPALALLVATMLRI
jgi:hypothetical protein